MCDKNQNIHFDKHNVQLYNTKTKKVCYTIVPVPCCRAENLLMPANSKKTFSRPIGYPPEERVQRACAALASSTPDVVYRTCCVKLHNPSQRKRAALLEVFSNNTLAAAWMLRDIEQRDPLHRFAKFRKRNSTSYYSKGIGDYLDKEYRSKVRSRYALNSSVFNGLCTTIAAMVSGWLQRMTDAQKKGLLQRYRECAGFVIPVGKYTGKPLGSLARKVIYGYAFLAPTRAEYQEALHFIHIVLERRPEDESLRPAAEQYVMPFGPRRGRALGTMRPETLRRLQDLVTRDEQRADQFEQVREIAKDYLRFTPPGFPTLRSAGLSIERRRELEARHLDAIEAFGALPDANCDAAEDPLLTEDERARFALLQRDAYSATRRPVYVPIRWNRADAFVRGRDMGLGYEAERGRYVLVLHVLADNSRHRRTLSVKRDIYDVDNPTIKLTNGKRPSAAMLFEIECDTHEQAMLDQARRDADRWKAGTTTSGGCIRSATLHAHMGDDGAVWFEAEIAIGTNPDCIMPLEHIIGVHVDPQAGIFVSIHKLDGALCTVFRLDEAKIAQLLDNKDPQHQASLRPQQRTTKEQQHRTADALRELCVQFRAQLGIENVSYRHGISGLRRPRPQGEYESSSMITALLEYKLPLAYLPTPMDIRGLAPRRDCGVCGARQSPDTKRTDAFVCSKCGHDEPRHFNTAREVARRALWGLASRNVKKTKPSQNHPYTVAQ
jgi:hypothetical protein